MVRFDLSPFNFGKHIKSWDYVDDTEPIKDLDVGVKTIIAPEYLGSDTSIHGRYLPCPPQFGSIDFVIRHENLNQDITLSVRVYQARNIDGLGSEEIRKYHTEYKAVSGQPEVTFFLLLQNVDVTKGFVTVEVENINDSEVMVDCFALVRKKFIY